jgi:cob(I)alamin adenosyltransferase
MIAQQGYGASETTRIRYEALERCLQFIKGKWKTGERKLGAQTPNLTWLTMRHGFTWKSFDLDRDRKAARAAWYIARAWLLDESYDLGVFDEITHVINYGFVPLDEVLSALQARRADFTSFSPDATRLLN